MSWAQGAARHEVERLPHEGEHVHELPQKGERNPEEPPRKSKRMAKIYSHWQKGEHKIKMPSTGEGAGKPKRNAEMPPRGDERELKMLPQKDRHRPEVLPLSYRASEREVDTRTHTHTHTTHTHTRHTTPRYSTRAEAQRCTRNSIPFRNSDDG